VKAKALLLLILVCLPITFTLISPTEANSPQLIITDVQRTAHFQEYGMLLITDNITVFNPGPEPAFYVYAAYPLVEITKVLAFRALTTNGTNLFSRRVPSIGPNCTGWQVFLSEPIMAEKAVTFTAQMSLERSIQQDETIATVKFSPVPTSSYLIQSYTTQLTYDDELLTSPSQTMWTGIDIHPYSFTETAVTIEYIVNVFRPIITYLELRRVLHIDEWGYLYVNEEHTLRLDSSNPQFTTDPDRNWDSIILTLPRGSEFIRAFEGIANLSSQIVVLPNAMHSGSVNVGFQYHIKEGDVYQFFLQYRMPLDYYQQVLQTGQLLVFNPYYEEPFLIRSQITEFHLPLGTWLQGIPVGAETTISPTGEYLVKFLDANVTSLSQGEISLYYVYSIQPALVRPMLLFILFSAICLVYIAARRIPFFREEEEIIGPVAEVDPAILSEFCVLYGEKIALLLQTERLEQSMLQGKISKPRYRKEKKNFERKLRSLQRDLENRTQPLIDAGGKYESSCRQLEVLEAERVSAIEGLHALEQRYRQKRITASVYQKLRKDIQKRRDKAVSRMDRILLTLREDLIE
jgi:hypothetical protein